MSGKPFAPAAERNASAILGVLRTEFRESGSVFEIGAGTGQHAACFAAALSHLSWQPSDVAENVHGIRAWVEEAALSNLREPITVDVLASVEMPNKYDGVFTANTAHIMSFVAVRRMFALASDSLRPGGKFLLYGPLRRGGQFNTASNAAFHESLQRSDPEMGIRDLEDLDRLAAAGGMRRERVYAMPANNHVVVWRRRSGAK